MAEQGQNGVGDSGRLDGGTVPVVNLLDDKPSKEDLGSGGHTRVAKAIMALVWGENDGTAIGLEGSWGSGKSTVIEFLRSECDEARKDSSPDVRVFVFDAWKHEDDPLRVAFLSRLCDALKCYGWLDDEAHKVNEREFDQLRGKLTIESQTDTALFRARDLLVIALVFVIVPLLLSDRVAGVRSIEDAFNLVSVAPAYWLLGAIIVIALAAWLQRALSSALAMVVEPKHRWTICPTTQVLSGMALAGVGVTALAHFGNQSLLWVSLALSLLLAIVGALQLRLRDGSSWDPKRSDRIRPKWLPLAHVPAAFRRPSFVEHLLKRQPHESETEIRGRRQIGVEDLEELFANLLHPAFTPKHNDHHLRNDRRLVIVLDNLDRLEAKDAISAWSTLRSLIEDAGSDALENAPHKKYMKYVWLVVPYDRTQIASLWPNKGPGQDPKGSVHHDRPSAFLDKTFAIRFDVPPFTGTDWREAAHWALGDAFPTMIEEPLIGQRPGAVEEIIRLIAHRAVKSGHPPTLRSTKLLVNDIGALVRQHGARLSAREWKQYDDEITFTLPVLAAYAMLRRTPLSAERIRQLLMNDASEGWDALPPGWLNSNRATLLACLVFNTYDEKMARELLWAGIIGSVLAGNDARDVARHAEGPVFWIVLSESRDKVADAAASRGYRGMPYVGMNLSTLASHASDSRFRDCELLCEEIVARIPDWDLDQNLQDVVDSLSLFASSPQVVGKLASVLNNQALRTVTDDNGRLLGSCWTTLWSAIDKLPKPEQQARSVASIGRQVFLPRSPEHAFAFLTILYDSSGADRSRWRLLAEPEGNGLVAALSPKANEKPWTLERANAARVLAYSDHIQIDWRSIANETVQVWSNMESLTPQNLDAALSFFRADGLGLTELDPSIERIPNRNGQLLKTAMEALRNDGFLFEQLSKLRTSHDPKPGAAIIMALGATGRLEEPPNTPPGHKPRWEVVKNEIMEDERSTRYAKELAGYPPEALFKFIDKRLEGHDAQLLARKVIEAMDGFTLRRAYHSRFLFKRVDNLFHLDSIGSEFPAALIRKLDEPGPEFSQTLTDVLMGAEDQQAAAVLAGILFSTGMADAELRDHARRRAADSSRLDSSYWRDALQRLPD